MNYHKNSYTGSIQKKILFRVLAVVAALTVVSAATVAYGNYLKSKAERTQLAGTGAGRPQQSSGAGREPDKNPQGVSVKSRCVPITSLDSNGAAGYVSTLADNGSTGISAVLADREGYLTYSSDAVAKFTHQKPAASEADAVIRAAISRAKERSMRTSALIFAAEDFTDGGICAQIDALVAADAAAFGFDELVVFLPIDTEQLGSELAAKIVAYLNALAANANGCSLGVCLSYDVFATPRLSPHLELISASSDFLAVDLTSGVSGGAEGAAKYVADATQTLAGSFSLYSLRAVFDGADADIADAQVKALADRDFENYMFVSATPIRPDTDDTQDSGNAQGGQNDPPPPQDPNAGGTGNTPEPDPDPAPAPDPEPSPEPASKPQANGGANGSAPSGTPAPSAPTAPDDDTPDEPNVPSTPDVPGQAPGGDVVVTGPEADPSQATTPSADPAVPNGDS